MTYSRVGQAGSGLWDMMSVIFGGIAIGCKNRNIISCGIPFLVSGWSTLTEDLRRGSNWSSPLSEDNGGSSNPWQTSADLLLPLRRSSVSVDHPLTRKGILGEEKCSLPTRI